MTFIGKRRADDFSNVETSAFIHMLVGIAENVTAVFEGSWRFEYHAPYYGKWLYQSLGITTTLLIYDH